MSSFDDQLEEELKRLEEEKKKKQKKNLPQTGLISTNPLGRNTARYDRVREAAKLKAKQNAIAKQAEINKAQNSWFKSGAFADGYDPGDLIRTIEGTAGDAVRGVAKGAMRTVEGIADFLTYGASSMARRNGAEELADAYNRTAQYSWTDKILGGTGDWLDQYSILGGKADNVAEGVGQVGLTMLTAGLGQWANMSSLGVNALTTGTMFASSAGSGMTEAYGSGASDEEALAYGLIAGTADAVTEMFFAGMGKSVNALGFSKGLSSADDMLAKAVSSRISNTFAKNAVQWGIKAGAEGAEEVLAGIAQAIGKWVTYKSEEELSQILADEKLLEQFIVGAATSGIVQSPGMVQTTTSGQDFITGYTKNDQAVIDRVIKDRIAEAEEAGQKLTAKEKAAIKAEVEADLEKGYISTDTIEEMLGGDKFKAYQDTITQENDALAELAELYEGDELQQKAEEFMASSKRGEAAQALRDSVYDLVKDSRLGESYREVGRRTQKFEVDLNQYTDEKQRAIVQKAVESGVLNNTNRTHDMVNWVSSVAAKLDTNFDFTNNEKLKDSIFAVDGKTVDGYVTKDGIVINVNSPKYINTVVGHEISHVLEGSNLYDALESTMIEYAKEKGTYQDVMKAAYELYHNVEGYQGADGLKKIKKEAVANMVGDYLFTDKNFINRLAKNQNVFQKVWNEIKYMVKIARAGSNEHKKLLEVQRAFERAYREGAQNNTAVDSGVQLSISKTSKIPFSIQLEQIENRSLNGSNSLYVGIPAVHLQNAGFSDSPFAMNQSDYRKSRRESGKNAHYSSHSVPYSFFKNMPQNLADAPMVIDNGKKATVITPYAMKDTKGNDSYVIAGVLRNETMESDTVNLVKSVYPFDDIAHRIISDAEDGKLVVINKNKAEEMLATIGIQPSEVSRILNLAKDSLSQLDESVNRRFSLSDSDGNQLTKEQAEYFKDSVIRDENGNLMPMYHGTVHGGFTVFGGRKDYWYFTNDKKYAYIFEGRKANGQLYPDTKEGIEKGYYTPQRYEVYLNVKNPFITEDVDIVEDALYWDKSLAGRLRENGYDALMLKDMSQVIVLNANQIKNVDNVNPTDDPDIRFSLSGENTLPGNYGNYRVKGEEIAYKEMLPVDETKVQTKAPAAKVAAEPAEELFPDDVTPIQEELEKLNLQLQEVRGGLEAAVNVGDYGTVAELTTEYEDTLSRIRELEAQEAAYEHDRLDSLDERDAPPENEPYYGEGEQAAVENPFEDRDWYGVSNRSVKAYMYENPEVKPFFQDEALALMAELHDTTRGEKFYSEEAFMKYGNEAAWTGVKRHTSKSIETLLDSWGMSYADIEKGLNAIIEDNGAENIAAAKKIEFMLNDRLLNGYSDFFSNGYIPPNQEYINMLEEKQINEYSADAFARFMETADQYAPPAAAPKVTPKTEAAPAAPIYDAKQKKGVLEGQQAMFEEPETKTVPKRSEVHNRILDHIRNLFARNGMDFDQVLKNAKNLSTWSTVDNTPQRVMEKALGYKEGKILSDITVDRVARNETQGIKWLNSFTNRKSGLLKQISDQYHIKPGSKESAAAQMYAEGFYVNDKNEIIRYGDPELIQDFPDANVRNNIKGLARDPRIRKIYDDTLAMINDSRTRNAYPEIPRLDNYFLHFRAMDDTFSRLGLPFNPNDIRAKDLPTDLNGVTADLKPGQPYFASAMHRTGKRTSFDLLGGLEKYLTSAKNQIFHIDDIQTLRAVRNYIADTFGQANGLENLDSLSEDEAELRIQQVYGSHLSTFAKFLNEEANVIAGKTALIDRGLEGIIGRRGMTTMDTINQQVGKNMVGFNVSSALTNFLSAAQGFAKTNKFDFVKALAQTAANKVGSIFGNGDSFAEESPVIIRRKGADRFYRTPWQKAGDAGYVLMSAVDNISTELIARAKYNELTRKGMDSQTAHIETDKWVSRLMGDRSLGQQPQLYNSKMLGLLTKFQLEVRNQLDSQFYDTIQEAKVSTEHIQNGLERNAKKAAKIASTFFQLAVVQHLFGKAFESVAGYNPAFDIISVVSTLFGWDDEEDEEDTVLDNVEQAFLELLEDLPYTSTLTGGRIPISSALPIEELVKGVDQYGNEKSRWETLGEVLPYYLLPGGYGQIKKTKAGLSMFDDDLPISGSYTDSGNLRFPVEETPWNVAQAALFGQWASENARDYFDNERSPLKPNQIQEFIDSGLPIGDYWDYREGLSGLDSMDDKGDYIGGLDLPMAVKNLLINNIADREDPIDMTNYDQYPNFHEFDWGEQNKAKYAFLQEHGMSYADYEALDEDSKKAYTWAFNNPERYEFIKGFGLTATEYYSLDKDSKDAYSWAFNNTEKYEFIKGFGLTPTEYYSLDKDSKDAYSWAYENPEAYTVSRAVSDDLVEYYSYKRKISEIGKRNDSSSGIKDKDLIRDYIFGLDLDYGQKIILYRSMYDSKADKEEYNVDIINYLNGRRDLTRDEKILILNKLGFYVDRNGRISW